MKYFTPEKYQALQASSGEAMDAGDDNWERAVTDYERHLQIIRPDLPESIRHLQDDFYLHDADVILMGRQGNDFVIALWLTTPPGNFLVLTYYLVKEPTITSIGCPREQLSRKTKWLFDEIDVVPGAERTFIHAILLSNGCHVQLSFREVRAALLQSLLPEPFPHAETLAGV